MTTDDASARADTPGERTDEPSSSGDWTPTCPFCRSTAVRVELPFGSALSKTQCSCEDCGTIFERIRWEGQHPDRTPAPRR